LATLTQLIHPGGFEAARPPGSLELWVLRIFWSVVALAMVAAVLWMLLL
jgi:hypothetical protein